MMIERKCRDGRGRLCPRPATVTLIAPDGTSVPGCAMCREHVDEVIAEYCEKLGETWTALLLNEVEKHIADGIKRGLSAQQIADTVNLEIWG